MGKPRLLDLFCGAGGASMGYHLAGFEVVGVDHLPQKHFPFEFHEADALVFCQVHGHEYDVIHASPPCQAYSRFRALHAIRTYPDLYMQTRDALTATGTPWVIENVVGAPYRNGVVLCGSMFGLPIWRHRVFESNVVMLVPECMHRDQGELVGIYGASDGQHESGFKHPGWKRGPRQATTQEAREIMGMQWTTTRKEVIEAVPPAFTEYIGRQLLRGVAYHG